MLRGELRRGPGPHMLPMGQPRASAWLLPASPCPPPQQGCSQQGCPWMRLALDEAVHQPGHGLCQGTGLGAAGRDDRAEHPLAWGGETPKGTWPSPAKPEKGQGPGSKSPLPARGCQLAPSPSTGVPRVPPSRVPIMPHRVMAGRAALARVLPWGGLGEDGGR